MQLAVISALLGSILVGCYGDNNYDMLLNNLYRMAELDNGYYGDDNDNDNDLPPLMENPAWQEALRTDRAQLRDQEHQSDIPLWGYQYISGGAGEGKQHLSPSGETPNKQEVKTDEILPFYCHPPNPCPFGYTEKDGCHEQIKDEKQFQKMYLHHQMGSGECNCDNDHMEPASCPSGGNNVNTESAAEQRQLDAVIEQLLGDPTGPADNPYAAGEKRGSLVAKKHFGLPLRKRGDQ